MAFRPMMHCMVALLVLLLVSSFGSVRADPTEAQVQATYYFLKNLTAGIPEIAAEWTGDTYEGWTGVTIGSDGFVDVYLANEGLSGWLLGNAAQSTDDTILVTDIDLSGNPNLVGRFDDSWAKLKALETLDLSNTGVFGNIPDAWNGMVSLQSVKISNVQACGGLPNWNISTLQSVDLSKANLKGTLASSWVSMHKLSSVDLSGNSFCGCVPTAWATNSVLKNAVSGFAAADTTTCSTTNACTDASYVCYTATSSSTTTTTTTTTSSSTAAPTESTEEPSSSVNAATLKFLQNLVAGIPEIAAEWIGDTYEGWTGVTIGSDGFVDVYLANEGLSGTLLGNAAQSINDPILVTDIDLSGNPNLVGRFDDSWAKLKALETLDLSNTGVFGNIPDAWNGMVSLQSVKISNVQACGGLPNWNISTLQSVDLSKANLKGALASSWVDMHKLSSVDLSGNSFCGCVPSEWDGHTVLTSAVSGFAAADTTTCRTTNFCTEASYSCTPVTPSSTSSTSTSTSTSTTAAPTSSSSTSTTATPSTGVSTPTLLFLQNLAAGIPALASAWTGSNYNGWTGVTVDASGSVHVDLSGRGLSGALPSAAATRNGILVTSLDLSGNPKLVGRFDDSWAKLTVLETLDLSNTGVYGNIPDAWNGMVSLQSVKISNVQACGGLPNWAIAALQKADLSKANLKGALASSWVDMHKLSSVDLSGNSFCGCVPAAWAANDVLKSAVSGLAVSSPTCGTTNVCTDASYVCSSTTVKPNGAALGSAAVASCVTLATLAAALLLV